MNFLAPTKEERSDDAISASILLVRKRSFLTIGYIIALLSSRLSRAMIRFSSRLI